MSTIGGKIDLSQLKHVLMTKKGKSGMVEGIFIPIEQNDLFKGKNNNVYLDIICFDAVNKEYKQTHAIKQSFPKDKYTKDELKEKPFLGSLNVDLFANKNEASPNNPVDDVLAENDDLPF